MRDGLYRRRYKDKKTGKIKTASTWWHRDPVSGKEQSTGYSDKKAAELYRAERQRAAADPAYAASKAAQVGEWASRLIAHKEKRRTAGTLHMYKTKIGHVVRIFGAERPLADIDPNLVDKYVAQREEEGVEPPTIGKELTALSQMLKLARRAEVYSRDVRTLRPVDYSTKSKARTRALRPTEIDLLERESLPAKFAVVFGIIATSCRDSEFRRLTKSDYNQQTGLIRIRGTKTEGSDRTIPVISIFRDRFERKVLPYLPTKYRDTSRIIARACVKAGLAHATSNDLRRTCATLMAASRIPFDLAAQVMGHVNSQMLREVYVQLAPEQLQRAIESGLRSADLRQSSVLGGNPCVAATGLGFSKGAGNALCRN